MRKMTCADVINFQTVFRETQQSSYIIEVTGRALLGPSWGHHTRILAWVVNRLHRPVLIGQVLPHFKTRKYVIFACFLFSFIDKFWNKHPTPSPSRNALGTPLSISVYFNFVKIPTTAASFSLCLFLNALQDNKIHCLNVLRRSFQYFV